MRAHLPLRSVRVIATSAHAMPGGRDKFLAAGLDAYLAKPIASRAALLKSVRRAILA
jgi:CheY-like chemotaxis protein